MLERFHHSKTTRIAGCDEAGRGCLAGPVFAAAVILPESFSCPALNDSKKLSESKRNELRIYIEENALAYGVGFCDHIEIDKLNILQASFAAMHKAIIQLKTRPEFLIIDGNRFLPFPKIKHQCIIKGDGIYESIAAASILAKTHRDEFMCKMHNKYPHYFWNRNKGYPTRQHRTAIQHFGASPIHRKSFKLLPGALETKMLFDNKERP